MQSTINTQNLHGIDSLPPRLLPGFSVTQCVAGEEPENKAIHATLPTS